MLVREQTEGLSYARGKGEVNAAGEAYDTMQITRRGTERVNRFAFQLAQQRKRKRGHARLTCIDKANVFTSMAFFRDVFNDVAQGFGEMQADHAYVDAMALTMVAKPWTLDVLVTENMFGDIMSDLAAGLTGGMGMPPSADIGDDHGLFQPAHGTAPDIAGQDKAKPRGDVPVRRHDARLARRSSRRAGTRGACPTHRAGAGARTGVGSGPADGVHLVRIISCLDAENVKH